MDPFLRPLFRGFWHGIAVSDGCTDAGALLPANVPYSKVSQLLQSLRYEAPGQASKKAGKKAQHNKEKQSKNSHLPQ